MQQKDEKGVWICPEYPDIELDQDKVAYAVKALCQVISVRQIDIPPEERSAYGLSPARRKITLTLIDGEEVCYILGDLNTYTNRFYFQLDQRDAVYLVGYSVGASAQYGIEEYLLD